MKQPICFFTHTTQGYNTPVVGVETKAKQPFTIAQIESNSKKERDNDLSFLGVK